MSRLTQASAVRIALVALLGLVVLEYVWIETQPGAGRPGRSGRVGALRSACPAPDALESHGAAEYNWKIQALDGSEVSFEQFRDKVIFVNVWATWCGPCREEMPAIQSLYDTQAQKGVVFVVLSEEELPKVKAWTAKENYTFPVYVSQGSLPSVFESPGIPSTFVVNRAGQIVLKRVGARDWNAKACHDFLQALL